jgi:hypothetical protein
MNRQQTNIADVMRNQGKAKFNTPDSTIIHISDLLRFHLFATLFPTKPFIVLESFLKLIIVGSFADKEESN